jgi:hypothetical protein
MQFRIGDLVTLAYEGNGTVTAKDCSESLARLNADQCEGPAAALISIVEGKLLKNLAGARLELTEIAVFMDGCRASDGRQYFSTFVAARSKDLRDAYVEVIKGIQDWGVGEHQNRGPLVATEDFYNTADPYCHVEELDSQVRQAAAADADLPVVGQYDIASPKPKPPIVDAPPNGALEMRERDELGPEDRFKYFAQQIAKGHRFDRDRAGAHVAVLAVTVDSAHNNDLRARAALFVIVTLPNAQAGLDDQVRRLKQRMGAIAAFVMAQGLFAQSNSTNELVRRRNIVFGDDAYVRIGGWPQAERRSVWFKADDGDPPHNVKPGELSEVVSRYYQDLLNLHQTHFPANERFRNGVAFAERLKSLDQRQKKNLHDAAKGLLLRDDGDATKSRPVTFASLAVMAAACFPRLAEAISEQIPSSSFALADLVPADNHQLKLRLLDFFWALSLSDAGHRGGNLLHWRMTERYLELTIEGFSFNGASAKGAKSM